MQLIQGDFREILPTLNVKADLAFLDLPYKKTRNGWDSLIPFNEVWDAVATISHEKTVIAFTGMQPFTSALVMSNLKMFRLEIIWAKNGGTDFMNAKMKPLNAHENLLIFYKSKGTYNPQKTAGHPRKVSTAHHKRNSKKTTNYGEHGLTGYDSTERYPTTVWRIASDKQKSALHPTQKPVALLEMLIRSYTQPGALVIDPVMGSGTMGIACLNAGREFIGIEKAVPYFTDAENRIETWQNEQ